MCRSLIPKCDPWWYLEPRMRDLAAHEKHQQQRLLKDLEDRGAELNDLKKNKSSLNGQLEEQQKVIAELQEQVDAALGAEEMVDFWLEMHKHLAPHPPHARSDFKSCPPGWTTDRSKPGSRREDWRTARRRYWSRTAPRHERRAPRNGPRNGTGTARGAGYGSH